MNLIRKLLLRILFPITLWVGKIHMPFSKKKITGKDYFEILSLLTPGAVLLTKTRGELSNMVNPGYWKHSAMYLGDSLVIEAIGRGVVLKDTISFFLSKDYVAVLKPKFADQSEMTGASLIAKQWEGRHYDYWFELNDKALYCYELVFRSYKTVFSRAKKEMPFSMKNKFGSPSLIGDDFFESDLWEVIWSNKSVS